jgi:hypothetical protein
VGTRLPLCLEAHLVQRRAEAGCLVGVAEILRLDLIRETVNSSTQCYRLWLTDCRCGASSQRQGRRRRIGSGWAHALPLNFQAVLRGSIAGPNVAARGHNASVAATIATASSLVGVGENWAVGGGDVVLMGFHFLPRHRQSKSLGWAE